MSDRSREESGSSRRDRRSTAYVAFVSVALFVAFVLVPPVQYTPSSGILEGTGTQGVVAAEPPDETIEATHERGVTGEGTKIGIVGSSFGPEARSLDAAVEGASFAGPTDGPTRGAPVGHDDRVATVVAGTAPDAELHLVGVGDAPSPGTYEEAIEWLISSDVDVIVDAGSYVPADGDTRSVFDRTADRAESEDVLFVTSAGNYGDRHWSEEVGTPGWVSFAPGTEANQLGTKTIDGRVSIRLYWEGDARFDLYLFNRRPNAEDAVVARDLDATGAARIDATVPEGVYYVAIHAPEGVDGTERLQLFSLRHDLSHTDPHDSVLEPAATDAESVLAVGAGAPDTPLRADSSRLDATIAGPGTVETTGGTLAGTSASAPYVAGTAALVKSSDETLSPEEMRELLSSTATREDDVAVVDPERAVSAVEPEASLSDRNGDEGGDDSADGR